MGGALTVSLQADRTLIPVNGSSTAQLTARVLANGSAAPGVTVVFSSDGGSVSPGSGVSDDAGVVLAALLAQVIGDFSVEARVGASVSTVAMRAVDGGAMTFSDVGTYAYVAVTGRVAIEARGASGAASFDAAMRAGGQGGLASGEFSVTPGEALRVFVAGQAVSAGCPTAGGGASAVEASAGARLLVVAAGGGGASCNLAGGPGGGAIGGTGLVSATDAGCCVAAGGGTQTAGGAGAACGGAPSAPGLSRAGGQAAGGAIGGMGWAPGGGPTVVSAGGGGGLFGGGAGLLEAAASSCFGSEASGAGGSSFLEPGAVNPLLVVGGADGGRSAPGSIVLWPR